MSKTGNRIVKVYSRRGCQFAVQFENGAEMSVVWGGLGTYTDNHNNMGQMLEDVVAESTTVEMYGREGCEDFIEKRFGGNPAAYADPNKILKAILDYSRGENGAQD